MLGELLLLLLLLEPCRRRLVPVLQVCMLQWVRRVGLRPDWAVRMDM